MAKTLYQRYCAALEARGLERLPKRNKYTMYRRPCGGTYFIGTHGAFRFTSSGADASRSIPVSEKFAAGLLDGSA